MNIMKYYSVLFEDKNCQLDLAVKQGDLELAEKLLSGDEVDVNFSLDGNGSLLHKATMKNDISMVKLLLMHNANANHSPRTPSSTRSPLWLATLYRYSAVAQLLISSGADPNECYGPRSSTSDEHNYDARTTLLQVAVSRRDCETARLLLAQGADATACNAQGESVLRHALAAECPVWLVRRLLEAGARPDLLVNPMNRTILHTVIVTGNADLARLILEQRDVDPTLRHFSGKSALHFAAEAYKESVPMAEMLLDRGLDVNDVDRIHLCSPLHLALKTGKEAMARVFLDRGADIKARTRAGLSPLYLAVEYGSASVVQLLLARGASVRVSEQAGPTPLHSACSHESEEKIRVLLSHGADVAAKDHVGRTAFQLMKNRRASAALPMVQRLTMLEKLDKLDPVNEADVQSVREDPCLREFHEQCFQEIEKMKRFKCYNNVSFYSVFARSEGRVAALLKNDDFPDVFAAAKHADLFPLYASDLEAKIEKAEEKMRLLCAMENHLRSYTFTKYLPDNALNRVISYLNPKDLPFGN